jgi:acyl-CoA synthetase (AMP-forming)/AMP-acid ligase II
VLEPAGDRAVVAVPAAAKPPVLVDWLPWHHTFGGNHNFNMVLFHGGTLYIDDGKPAPGLIERTAENLRRTRRRCTSTCRAGSTC